MLIAGCIVLGIGVMFILLDIIFFLSVRLYGNAVIGQKEKL